MPTPASVKVRHACEIVLRTLLAVGPDDPTQAAPQLLDPTLESVPTTLWLDPQAAQKPVHTRMTASRVSVEVSTLGAAVRISELRLYRVREGGDP